MTDKQPEALRLADLIDNQGPALRVEVSAELRRLHEVNAELVEALEKLARLGNEPMYGNSIGNVIAQEALRKAQGDNNG